MIALFILWRCAMLAVFVYGVAHARSPGSSLLCCAAFIWFAVETIRALVDVRRCK